METFRGEQHGSAGTGDLVMTGKQIEIQNQQSDGRRRSPMMIANFSRQAGNTAASAGYAVNAALRGRAANRAFPLLGLHASGSSGGPEETMPMDLSDTTAAQDFRRFGVLRRASERVSSGAVDDVNDAVVTLTQLRMTAHRATVALDGDTANVSVTEEKKPGMADGISDSEAHLGSPR